MANGVFPGRKRIATKPRQITGAGAAWLVKTCRHVAFSYDKLLVVCHLRLQEVPFGPSGVSADARAGPEEETAVIPKAIGQSPKSELMDLSPPISPHNSTKNHMAPTHGPPSTSAAPPKPLTLGLNLPVSVV